VLPPTADVLRIPSGSLLNVVGKQYLAVPIASKRGFSKVGFFKGLSRSNAPAIYCGFKPRFLMVKQMTGPNSNWYMLDTVRDQYNPMRSQLEPNLDLAETFGIVLDATSTGFVLRTASTGSFNGAGELYFFVAFAEVPTQFALAS
jgi:hypothetical protein